MLENKTEGMVVDRKGKGVHPRRESNLSFKMTWGHYKKRTQS